ncbi:hypothetical protein KEM54_000663 [Ascosphaera aggregata]|nr:hypothetical protein KEM54_000663 [Ascosphaera aggregata]
MFYWLFDISTFIAVISIVALAIAYEQMTQINKKGELAQMEAQLADERAAASERDARLTRESKPQGFQRLVQLEERLNEHHRLLRTLIEREEMNRVNKRNYIQTSELVPTPPLVRMESNGTTSSTPAIPLYTASLESIPFSDPLSPPITDIDIPPPPSIPETDSSSSVNMTRMKTAFANKCKKINKKMKLGEIRARAFSPKNILSKD